MADMEMNMNDEEAVEIITLTDDETGKEIEFELLMDSVFNGQRYFALLPMDEEGDEYVILKVKEDGEDLVLETVEDDEEFDAVEDYFNDQLFEEIDYDQE